MSEYKKEDVSLYCKLLGFYFACLILGSLRIGSVGSLLKLIGFMPIGLWLIEKRTINLNGIILSAFLFVCWTVLSYVWTIEPSLTLTRLTSQVTFLLLMFSVSAYNYNENEVYFLKKALVWSSRFTAIVLLLTGTYSEGRLYLSGLINEDPNYLCGYFLFSVVWCIRLLLTKNIRMLRKVCAFAELFVYVYLLFSTGSRGGLFAVVAAAMMAIMLRGSTGEQSAAFKKIVVIVIVFSITAIVSNFLPSEISERYTYDSISSSRGTGRYDIWSDTINAFFDYPLIRKIIGYGAATFKQITFLYSFKYHNVAHNIFLENLAELGIIGLSVYLNHLLNYLFPSIYKKNAYNCAVLTGLIVLSLSTSIQVFKPYWNIMIFVLVNEQATFCVEEGKEFL